MMIKTAKVFGLKTVAEGVENEKTLEYLNTQECHFYQGYYFSKAVLANKAELLLN